MNGNAKVVLSSALNKAQDSVQSYDTAFIPSAPVTATGYIIGVEKSIAGFNVTASSSGIWRIYNGTDTSGVKIYDSVAALTGGQIITFPKPIFCGSGIYAELVSGSGTIVPILA